MFLGSNTELQKVVIHSDGGCQGNPGPGGWAAVLTWGKLTREVSGGVPATTNNRMELMGAIEALNALNRPCEVEFHTDSQYVKNGVTAWMHGWKRNGWKTKAKEPVKNADLWRMLDEAVTRHKVSWHWVKGHAGHAENERCDELATKAMDDIRKRYTKAELQVCLKEFNESVSPSASDGVLIQNQ
ncbi:MAG: rnhA 2 [Verrucomicrobia bacterium]|nr:rnhA 2 [Verrucomicrobiota bacterium]